jgi:RNA polymerase sigma factor (sigma-70 family)
MPERLLNRIRRGALLRDGGGLSDGHLLTLFIRHRDGDAFEALLNRHGPMVLAVCRRVLLDRHDAEDAFQATFFVFARKAGSVAARGSVGGWLYRVAYRTALEARARIARRRCKEKQVDDVPHPVTEPDEGQRELLGLLDKELDRLPDKYRVPVVLCELEGRGRKEVARALGLPEGTLSWRLAQAKKLLARRLSRQGVSLTVGALATALSNGTASAGLSPTLRASTVKAALTAGTVPAQVLALSEGVMKAMLLTKLKITACFAVLMLLAGAGVTGLTYRATAQQPKQEPAYSNSFVAARQAPDDLESLRLEIEALRKELRATRERVKVLEGEMRSMKGKPGETGRATTDRRIDIKGGDRPGGGAPVPGPGGSGPGVGNPFGSSSGIGASGGTGNYPPGGTTASSERPHDRGKRLETPSDPVADAEAALKRLRQDPSDKEAADALERALKRLKEREKQRPPAGDKSGP